MQHGNNSEMSFPPSNSKRCILNPKGACYFICPHFTSETKVQRDQIGHPIIQGHLPEDEVRFGPSMPVILSHGLGREGKFEKASHSMPQRGARSVFSTASPPTFLALKLLDFFRGCFWSSWSLFMTPLQILMSVALSRFKSIALTCN